MRRKILIYKKIYKTRPDNILFRRLFLLSVFIFFLSLFLIRIVSSKKNTYQKTYKIYLTKDSEQEFKSKIENYQKNNSNIEITKVENNSDIIIDSSKPKSGYKDFLIKKEPGLIIKFLDQQKAIKKEKNYYLFYKTKSNIVDDLYKYLNENQNLNKINFNALGDIIPGRTVAKKMFIHGYNYPFEKIASYINKADIIYGNLECPLSDRLSPPYEGMNFLAPSSTINGLKLCNVNLVSLANNHSTNFGSEVFSDTLKILKENQINYFGGGLNKKEAKSPLFLNIKGIKFAFLNYNSIIGSIKAEENSPGVNWISIKPWSEVDNELEIQEMEKEIKEAKKKSDIVVVCFHWGVEYQLEPIDSQINLAHRAIESGASLIIGTHPHVVQPVEYYQSNKFKNKEGFIFYSLGNFIFDQMWSEETQEGIIAKMNFLGNNLTEIQLLPYKIEDYCQPNILNNDNEEAKLIIDRIISRSKL